MTKVETTEEALKLRNEIDEINDSIIQKQKVLIQKLQEQNKFLEEVIEKHLLGGKKITELVS